MCILHATTTMIATVTNTVAVMAIVIWLDIRRQQLVMGVTRIMTVQVARTAQLMVAVMPPMILSVTQVMTVRPARTVMFTATAMKKGMSVSAVAGMTMIVR